MLGFTLISNSKLSCLKNEATELHEEISVLHRLLAGLDPLWEKSLLLSKAAKISLVTVKNQGTWLAQDLVRQHLLVSVDHHDSQEPLPSPPLREMILCKISGDFWGLTEVDNTQRFFWFNAADVTVHRVLGDHDGTDSDDNFDPEE